MRLAKRGARLANRGLGPVDVTHGARQLVGLTTPRYNEVAPRDRVAQS